MFKKVTLKKIWNRLTMNMEIMGKADISERKKNIELFIEKSIESSKLYDLAPSLKFKIEVN